MYTLQGALLITSYHTPNYHVDVRNVDISHVALSSLDTRDYLVLTLIFFDCPSGEKSGRESCNAIKLNNSGTSPFLVAMIITDCYGDSRVQRSNRLTSR